MANIKYVQSVTTFQSFVDSIGQWNCPIPSMPSDNPDVCIVKGITFCGQAASTKIHLLWSSLAKGYIGSFSIANLSTQSPGTTIVLNKPVGNSIAFQLHIIDPVTEIASTDPSADGEIAIHLEFIKYKDTPPHA